MAAVLVSGGRVVVRWSVVWWSVVWGQLGLSELEQDVGAELGTQPAERAQRLRADLTRRHAKVLGDLVDAAVAQEPQLEHGTIAALEPAERVPEGEPQFGMIRGAASRSATSAVGRSQKLRRRRCPMCVRTSTVCAYAAGESMPHWPVRVPDLEHPGQRVLYEVLGGVEVARQRHRRSQQRSRLRSSEGREFTDVLDPPATSTLETRSTTKTHRVGIGVTGLDKRAAATSKPPCAAGDVAHNRRRRRLVAVNREAGTDAVRVLLSGVGKPDRAGNRGSPVPRGSDRGRVGQRRAHVAAAHPSAWRSDRRTGRRAGPAGLPARGCRRRRRPVVRRGRCPRTSRRGCSLRRGTCCRRASRLPSRRSSPSTACRASSPSPPCSTSSGYRSRGGGRPTGVRPTPRFPSGSRRRTARPDDPSAGWSDEAQEQRAIAELDPDGSGAVMGQAEAAGIYGQVQALFDAGRLVAAHTSVQLGVGAGGSAAARLGVEHGEAV